MQEQGAGPPERTLEGAVCSCGREQADPDDQDLNHRGEGRQDEQGNERAGAGPETVTRQLRADIESGAYPAPEHQYEMPPEERAKFNAKK